MSNQICDKGETKQGIVHTHKSENSQMTQNMVIAWMEACVLFLTYS